MTEANKNNSNQSPQRMTTYHASLDDFRPSPRPQSNHPSRMPQSPQSPQNPLQQNRRGSFFAKKQEGRDNRPKPRSDTHPRRNPNSAPVQHFNCKASKTLKLCHLGGLEEVGCNMAFLEYGNDIMIIDAGFSFPSDDMPGVDFVIPDVTYLQENRSRIKGIVLTHGHMDHIGALPYIIERLGNPTIYATNLTIGLLKEKLEEFGLNNRVKTVVVNPEKDKLLLGVFKVSFFRVNHNIPDTVGIVVDSPAGKVVHTADFKFDLTPINEPVIDLGKIAEIGNSGVAALLMDSTGSRNPGYAISESEIKENLLELFQKSKGRIFVASFSTLISRIQQVIDVTIAVNRNLTVTGRSMVAAIEVAGKLGYLKVPENLILSPQKAAKYPDEKIVVLSTGTQGEDASALTRMSRGEHKFFKIKRGDTVVLSSSIIPGNETKVVEVYDNLLRAGAKVVDYKQMDIHTSGHAHQEELKTMIRLLKPKYFVPVHGHRYLREANAELARSLGMAEDEIKVVDNGEVLEFSDQKCETLKAKILTSFVMVDGLGVGDVGNIVLRDRQAMAEGGIFVVILTVDHRNGEIITSPDIISRGFVYMRAAEDLIRRARHEVRSIFKRHISRQPADVQFIKTMIREEIGEFLYEETKRRPMVIPVIIEV
ncbi:MAG: ribonuclease J [Candidatus Berkelbacteria bacterium]|nr:ribonuclease J [Candidatus Berkelbacteria bacterium]